MIILQSRSPILLILINDPIYISISSSFRTFGLRIQSHMRDSVLAFRDNELIFFHEIFHDFKSRRIQFVQFSQLLLLLIELIHQILIPPDEAQSLPQ